jgi:hypothetical protein
VNRASQIRTKRQLVLLAVSHRALSDAVVTLADAIDEARAIFIDGSTRVLLSPAAWEDVALEMFQVLEDAMREEVPRARQA